MNNFRPALLALPFLLALSASASPSSTPPEAPILPKYPQPIENILKLQIFLDQQLFGPGKIDGRPGEFTTKALKRYEQSQGLPETEVETNTLNLSSVSSIYTTYTIRQEDMQFVGDLPTQPSAQSKKKYLPYSSVEDLLTERFHCSGDLLEYINKPIKMEALKVGDTVKVPNVQPFMIEELTPIASLPEVPEYKDRILKIDTKEKMLGLYEGDKLLASLPITPGSGHLATPPGKWHILGIAEMPTFRWDNSVLEYGVRSSNYYELPIGPRNPVGVMWIGLDRPGIGIHGTNNPQTIGRASSHGCMRTANWDTVRLAKMITKGMTVVIEGPPAEPREVIADAPPRPQPIAAVPPPQPRKFKWFWQK